MKIAILSPIAWRTPPRHYGPWEQVASNLTEGLVKLGLDVTLFATGDSITGAKLKSIVHTGYAEDPSADAKVIECLHISNLMENANDFDIIHNHFDFLPLSYSQLAKTPMITTIHGFSSSKIIPVYKKYSETTSYVSISDSNRSDELNYLATVYNGLNVQDFSFNDAPENYLLFFGRIHPHKGTFEAIEIAKRSGKTLVIAGIIQDQKYFNEKVNPHLSEEIQFIGSVEGDRRAAILGNALALLHPITFDEPFGLSVAEAMLCGTPVIAFNRGSMPELIKDQETGFLVNNMEEAIDAVSQLKRLNRNDCHQWSSTHFSQEKMVEDYVVCYEKILMR